MKVSAKPSKVLRQRVWKYVMALSKLFDVYNHQVSVVYKKENCPEQFAACIEYDEEYKRIYVKIYPEFFTADTETQASYLLHEFCHIFTIPFVEVIKDLHSGERFHPWKDLKTLSERQTTYIEQVLFFFLSGNAPDTRNAYKSFVGKTKKHG